jgi:hypothetical protein
LFRSTFVTLLRMVATNTFLKLCKRQEERTSEVTSFH